MNSQAIELIAAYNNKIEALEAILTNSKESINRADAPSGDYNWHADRRFEAEEAFCAKGNDLYDDLVEAIEALGFECPYTEEPSWQINMEDF